MTIEQFEKAANLVPEIKQLQYEIEMMESLNYSFGFWIGNRERTLSDVLSMKIYELIKAHYSDMMKHKMQLLSAITNP